MDALQSTSAFELVSNGVQYLEIILSLVLAIRRSAFGRALKDCAGRRIYV